MGEKVDVGTGEIVPDPYQQPTKISPLVPVPVEVHTGPVPILPAHPPDLRLALEQWQSDRDYIKRFLLEHLRESDYNDKGYPMKGRMNDYYRLPGKQGDPPEWRPTEVGAEKVALFFGLFKSQPQITVIEATKEHIAVKASVSLVDARGNVRGGSEKIVSSAEQTFQAAAYKYKGDWRAALNDVASRAAKRAYVEAVTVTCALGELFNEIARIKAGQPKGQLAPAQQSQTTDSNGQKRADPKPDARGLPTVMPFGKYAGKPLKDFKTESLEKIAAACRGNPQLEKLHEAVTELLEFRRES